MSEPSAILSGMGEVFVGSEAIATGRLTRKELRRWYQPIYRGVYAPKHAAPSLRDRTVAAWLASDRRGVIAGVAASALHGAPWVDDDEVIELVSGRARRQRGVLIREDTLAADEITKVAGIPVTTRTRTAFDLGRRLPRLEALQRLDALMWSQVFSIEDVLGLAKRYRRARGLRQLRELLPLVDGNAASPRETQLRLMFIDAGLPTPTTQIPVVDERGRLVRILDMGWKEFKVGAEYDGDQHRTDRKQYVKDMRAMRKLEILGWLTIRAIKEDRDEEIIERTTKAMVSRGWKP